MVFLIPAHVSNIRPVAQESSLTPLLLSPIPPHPVQCISKFYLASLTYDLHNYPIDPSNHPHTPGLLKYSPTGLPAYALAASLWSFFKTKARAVPQNISQILSHLFPKPCEDSSRQSEPKAGFTMTSKGPCVLAPCPLSYFLNYSLLLPSSHTSLLLLLNMPSISLFCGPL